MPHCLLDKMVVRSVCARGGCEGSVSSWTERTQTSQRQRPLWLPGGTVTIVSYRTLSVPSASRFLNTTGHTALPRALAACTIIYSVALVCVFSFKPDSLCFLTLF